MVAFPKNNQEKFIQTLLCLVLFFEKYYKIYKEGGKK